MIDSIAGLHEGKAPDTSRRDSFPYTWYASCGMPVYAALAGIRFDRTFREVDAIIEAYASGEPKARALFGAEVRYGGPTWSGISYGHVNCLGAPLFFPPESEVAHRPIYDSLEQGIQALDREVDWASAGMMPFYLDLWEQLQAAFPGHEIPFGGYGYEGPITTAWELRGHGFFTDLYDAPERCRDFLMLVTDSIIDYAAFIRSLNGQPAFLETRVGLYDDVASLIHPDMWPDVVLPHHERFFARQTSGPRHAHIENLTVEHLSHLDALRLDSYDPSVSTRIEPRDVRDRCQVPFLWRLTSMQVRDMTAQEIRRFVFKSIAEGASGVFCTLSRTMIDPEPVSKVHTFMDAAKQVGQLLQAGVPRERLCERLGQADPEE